MARFGRLRSLLSTGLLALAGSGAVTAYSAAALAQEPLGIEPPPSPPAAEGIEQAVVARYWELGRPRLFFASIVEAGYLYAKPRFAFGYGLPHWRWFGLEAYPLLSLGGVGHYAGIAAAVPRLQARAGSRYYYPFSRELLPPQASFNRTEIELLDGPRADYLSLEAELVGTLPVPAGSLFGVLTGYYIPTGSGGSGLDSFLVEEGFYLYEETLRTVMKPPYIWRARLGYLLAFGRDSAIRIGPAAEVIGMPGRDEFVVRGGAVGSVAIDAYVEAQASFIPVILSPDNLGIAGGDFGQLGVRWRWATGSKPDPEKLRKARAKRLEELKRTRARDLPENAR